MSGSAASPFIINDLADIALELHVGHPLWFCGFPDLLFLLPAKMSGHSAQEVVADIYYIFLQELFRV